jgi:hypothetical protein
VLKYILPLLLLVPVAAEAQATRIATSSTLPTVCRVGAVYLKTGGSDGFYYCAALNTWTGPLVNGGAPTTATFITQTADGTLSNEQALSSLSTGIMRVATTTGVITSLTDSSGIAANISDESGSGALLFGTSPTITTPTISGAITFPDDVRQIFNPGTTNAGINVGALAGDPGSPSNGDLWYDSAANQLTARINGANVALGAGGGGGTHALSDHTALAADLTLDNDAYLIDWSWDLSGASPSAVTFQEGTATGGGGGNLLKLKTLATSTATPLFIDKIGTNAAVAVFTENSDNSYCLTADGYQAIRIGGGAASTCLNPFGVPYYIRMDAGGQFAEWTDNTNGTFLSIVSNNTRFGTSTGHDVSFYTNNAARMTIASAGTISFGDGLKVTFNPDGTNPGVNVGSHAGDPSAPSNGDIWYNSSTNELTARINGANVDLLGTHSVSFPQQFVVAVCQNATASLGGSTPTSDPAVAACVTGSNTQFGVAQFANGANALSVQYHMWLPEDWTGDVDVKGKWRTSATSGDVVWQVQTACVADAQTADPAFNTASTVTDTAKGTTLQTNDFSLTSITMTGCAAGEQLFLKVSRDPAHASDTLAATAELIHFVLILRRTV